MNNSEEDIVLTRDQVREVDRRAIEDYGIPGIVLMENAARNAAEVIRGISPPDARVAIVCGRGNNGGDGFAIARHLFNCGVRTELFLTCDPRQLRGDAATNHDIVQKMKLPSHRFDTAEHIETTKSLLETAGVIVDAILGTGFTGEVRSPYDAAINAINDTAGATVVAIDVPSGLDCDTGKPSNAVIRADVTVTFVAKKAGFDTPGAARYTGRVHVADIGAPRTLLQDVLAAAGAG